METTGSPGLSGLKITQPSGNKYAMLAVSAGSFTPDYVNDIDEKILNKSVKNNTENNDNQLEDKISSYQNTNREKTLMRELKRLQNFQTFLVAQIDQLGRHRKSDQLAKEINDLKRAILRIPRTPLTIELARKSNNNSDRKRKKKKSRRTVGSQTAAPRSMKAMTNRIDDFCDYSNNIDDDINNTSSNKVIMSPTGNASSLPSLFSNNDNLNQQQQRFMEEKEVHAAFEYASENFFVAASTATFLLPTPPNNSRFNLSIFNFASTNWVSRSNNFEVKSKFFSSISLVIPDKGVENSPASKYCPDK